MKSVRTAVLILGLLFLPLASVDRQTTEIGLSQYNVSSTDSNLKTNVWFVWDNQSQSCQCGSDLLGIVECDTATRQLSVLVCFCLTIDYNKQFPVI